MRAGTVEFMRGRFSVQAGDDLWLCKCGADLAGDEYQCAACAARMEEDSKRQRAEFERRERHGYVRRNTEELARRVGGALDATELARRIRLPGLHGVYKYWDPSRGPLCILAQSGFGKTEALRQLVRRGIADAYAAADAATVSLSAWTVPWVCGAHWATGPELARSIRENRLGQKNERLDEAREAGTLILDEIGQESADPRWLLELLDERYSRGCPTISTSGLTRPELEKHYGAGAFRRLFEPGTLLDLHPEPEETGG